MNTFLLDTDTITLYLQQNPIVIQHILRRLSDRLILSVITMQEIVTGWLTAIRQARSAHRVVQSYYHLTRSFNLLQPFPVVDFPMATLDRFEALQKLRLNVGNNDLKIAATAIEPGAIVVSRNRRDFSRVPSLSIEDWSV